MKMLQIFLILLLMISCSQKENKKTRLTIKFEKNKSSMEKDFGLGDPTSYAELNCFGIFVDYPEIDSGNACTIDPNTPFKFVRPDEVGGLVPINGGELSLDVLAGEGRKIQIVAFKANSPADFCPSVLMDFDPYEEYMSNPFVIAEEIHNIPPGEYSITIPAKYLSTANANTKLDDCVGPFFQSSDTFELCSNTNACAYHMDVSLGAWEDVNCMTTPAIDTSMVQCISNLTSDSFNYISATGPIYEVSASNGIPMLSFDGTSKFLQPPVGKFVLSDMPSTIAIAFSTPSAGNLNGNCLVGNYKSVVSGVKLCVSDSSLNADFTFNASPYFRNVNKTGSMTANNEAHIALLTYNISEAAICLDNNCNTGTAPEILPGTTAGAPRLHVGVNYDGTSTSYFTNAKIGEILIYNQYMDSVERTKIINYLKSKWGIP